MLLQNEVDGTDEHIMATTVFNNTKTRQQINTLKDELVSSNSTITFNINTTTKTNYNITNHSTGSIELGYEYEKTMSRSGFPGRGYNSHVRFTVPRTFTSNDKIQIVDKDYNPMDTGSNYNDLSIEYDQ